MRALVLACLLGGGCYDLGVLDRASVDGGIGAGDGGGGSGGSWQALAPVTTAALRGVSGSSSGDVVAVGAASTIVRLAAAGTPALDVAPPGYNLRAVWVGSGAALAVGDNETVLERGGSNWDGFSLSDLTLYAVTGGVNGGAVAVGSGGSIVHQSLTGWDAEDSQVAVALHSVSARSATEALAVGDRGTIVHGTGGAPLAWVVENSGVAADLFAVWATATDAWIVGAGGVILHADAGDAWVAETSNTSADLFGVFGDGESVWAVGAGGTILRRSGTSWSVEHTGGADLHAVWAAGAGEAWAVGDAGTILHRTNHTSQ